jgi:hypothetical protein
MYGRNISLSEEHKNKISKSLLESVKFRESRQSEEYKKKISD